MEGYNHCISHLDSFLNFVIFQFDTAKVLIQTQKTSEPKQYSGTFDCLRKAVQRKGVLSLYDGVGSRLIGGMAENAVSFVVYASLKRELLRQKQQQQGNNEPVKLSFWDISIAGSGAGAVSAFVMTPVELIKCRLQVSSQLPTPQYKSMYDCIKQTVQQGGLTGFYKGHTSTLCREIPGNFIWYLTYEMVCDTLASPHFLDKPRDQLPVGAQMAGGATAGVVYWAAVFPIDTVKSVLQTQATVAASASHRHLSFWQILQNIYSHQGIRGLYRGFGGTAMRAAPADALIFAGYEQTVKFLKGK